MLELIAYTVATEWVALPVVPAFKRQLYAIMPQAVAAWARRRGHHVTYATYYGQADPLALMPPGELDLVFLATSSQGSALAYALAALYRAAGVRTVLGGPHAAGYPEDCARFVDVTVTRCDEDLVAGILAGDHPPGTILGSARPPAAIPSIEERLPDIATAAFAPCGRGGRPMRSSVIPLYASLGCPYDCGFCTDWDSTYRPVPAADLAADLGFVARRFPGTLLGFHDPNFGIRLDDALAALEAVPPDRRSPYLMQASLSVLTPARAARLGATRCLYVAPGIESWSGFGRKMGREAGAAAGTARVASLAARFDALHRHVPGLQANFVLGLDSDEGEEPFALTRAFLERTPYAWPNINVLTPYAGTPFHDALRREGRLLEAMPPALLCSPYLALVPRHYDALGFYRRFVALLEASVAPGLTLRRALLVDDRATIKLSRLAQTLAVRRDIAEMRAIRDALRDDPGLRRFHERGGPLPPLYRGHLRRRLGRYAAALPEAAWGPPVLPAPRRAAA